MSHDPEAKPLLLTALRTTDRGPSDPLSAEEIVEVILRWLDNESFHIVRSVP